MIKIKRALLFHKDKFLNRNVQMINMQGVLYSGVISLGGTDGACYFHITQNGGGSAYRLVYKYSLINNFSELKEVRTYNTNELIKLW